MGKKVDQDYYFSLEYTAESCATILLHEVQGIVKGNLPSCPTLIASELQHLVGRHPLINTVAEASLVVAEHGIDAINYLMSYYYPIVGAGGSASKLAPAQLAKAKTDFRVSLKCPDCSISYRLSKPCFSEICGIARRCKLPLDESIKIALLTGLGWAEDWVPRSRRVMFGRESIRFDDWQTMRLLWLSRFKQV